MLAGVAADAYTAAGSQRNHGAGPALQIAGPGSEVRKAFLRFDLSTLPHGTAGSDVTRATLTLFANRVKVPGALDALRVTSA